MVAKPQIWIFTATHSKREAFVIVRSPYRKMAQRKVQIITDGQGLLNWTFYRVKSEEAEVLLGKYELNALYERDV